MRGFRETPELSPHRKNFATRRPGMTRHVVRGSFDLIWREGAVYVMGFRAALANCARHCCGTGKWLR
jgi:hypothetical protein